jgi:small subunit ribosomal protein S9
VADRPPKDEPDAPEVVGDEQPREQPSNEQPQEQSQEQPQPAEEPSGGESAVDGPEQPPAEEPQAAAVEEQPAGEQSEAEADAGEAVVEAEPAAPADEPEKAPTPAELGADARYSATGKRKSSVARVILMPGKGGFELNGRSLDTYFPRKTLQEVVRQPLKVTGYLDRVDIRARIHGGGISSQADAVRHGIAKALIDADPQLRGELKRRQLLTRDPRVKERRKAGLKKARKRPQFSKR